MATPSDKPAAMQPAYVIPDCGCGETEFAGPNPLPGLPWKHCFKFYEFRYATAPIWRDNSATVDTGRLGTRVRYEHAFRLLGRKQGPIVHSLTLLPKEQIQICEYDRYRHATSATSRFSGRGELDLGIAGFGGGTTVFGGIKAGSHFDVTTVSERFAHIAETNSLAVETERSIVVSTFDENESVHPIAHVLRNDKECHAVTYFVRRVLEIYKLTTRVVGIEVQLGDLWVDISAAPQPIDDEVKQFLQQIDVGAKHEPRIEIALPTDVWVYDAAVAHCGSSDCLDAFDAVAASTAGT